MLTEKSTASKSNPENQKASARNGIIWLRWVFLILLFQASQYLFANLNMPEQKTSQDNSYSVVDAKSSLAEQTIVNSDPTLRDEFSHDVDGLTLALQQALESKTILQYFSMQRGEQSSVPAFSEFANALPTFSQVANSDW